jgi:retron-type reverse transcriptase
MRKIICQLSDVASLENLLVAWEEFLCGKSGKSDVRDFKLKLMDHLITLREDLLQRQYRHGGYEAFRIQDPKPRDIHKASVRDRLVHHAIYRVLYPEFDKRFIADSFSCRVNKGTHKALNRFRAMAYQVSLNHTRTCWILKCDIKKFFASIDHQVLKGILFRCVADGELLSLTSEIIDSFHSGQPGRGLPLGNLTSQLFVNIFMNEFDQFVKYRLRARHYIRYADDFVFLSGDRRELENLLLTIKSFLDSELRLALHPSKVELRTLVSGVDFLGWVHFPDHRVLRTTTKRRMNRMLKNNPSKEVMASYQGLLKHGNTYALRESIPTFD